jgi:hypothetical protein
MLKRGVKKGREGEEPDDRQGKKKERGKKKTKVVGQ